MIKLCLNCHLQQIRVLDSCTLPLNTPLSHELTNVHHATERITWPEFYFIKLHLDKKKKSNGLQKNTNVFVSISCEPEL